MADLPPDLPEQREGPEPLTAESVQAMGTFSSYRKYAATHISDFTIPPGVPYQTPEGLRAEDEPTRVAFDVQGGVYPIRESVFRETYEPALVTPSAPEAPSDTYNMWTDVPTAVDRPTPSANGDGGLPTDERLGRLAGEACAIEGHITEDATQDMAARVGAALRAALASPEPTEGT